MEQIIILEDSTRLLHYYSQILLSANYDVYRTSNSDEFFQVLTGIEPDVIILDIKLNNSILNGLEVFSKLSDYKNFKAKVIIISGEATRSEIAQAMQLGAYTFIEKDGDFNVDKFLSEIRQAINLKEQEEKNIKLQNNYESLRRQLIQTQPLIGESIIMKKLKDRMLRFAKADVDVLILGDTGTGKEVVANNLYWQSNRAGKPFLKVNVGGLSETLIDSELFGHKKGSFTSAYEDKTGLFEQASGGVLFLDEIANIGLNSQAKILRSIENKEVKKLGGKTRTVDVRIFFACNQDLSDLVNENKFRKDLYYRLEGNIIQIPTLRERKNDIYLIMDYFLKRYAEKHHCIDNSQLDSLQVDLLSYEWPGNVRELEKFCEYLFIFYDVVNNKIIEYEFHNKKSGKNILRDNGLTDYLEIRNFHDAVEKFERAYLHKKLQLLHWKVNKVADEIGLDRSTIYKKLKKLGLEI